MPVPAGLEFINRRFVGFVLVYGDLLGYIVGLHGFVKEAHGRGLVTLGSQQEVDRLALLGYRAVEIFPDGSCTPLVASIAFQTFSGKVLSIDQRAP